MKGLPVRRPELYSEDGRLLGAGDTELKRRSEMAGKRAVKNALRSPDGLRSANRGTCSRVAGIPDRAALHPGYIFFFHDSLCLLRVRSRSSASSCAIPSR